MKQFYILFVKNHGEYGNEAKILYGESFIKERNLIEQGFEMVADHFETKEKAEDYAELECNAYPHECCMCEHFLPTDLIRGIRLNNDLERRIVFNGRICEQCADTYEVIGHNHDTHFSDFWNGR